MMQPMTHDRAVDSTMTSMIDYKTIESITIRPMRIEDYERVARLWEEIDGFYIRSIDDSREGIARFLTRNPNTSVVATIQEAASGELAAESSADSGLDSPTKSKPKLHQNHQRMQERIIGSILCGHDGRYGSLYHVCVHRDFRKRGIGSRMVQAALEALKYEQISSISLIAFSENLIGNAFWRKQGWIQKPNANRYEFSLNSANTMHKTTPHESQSQSQRSHHE